MTYKSQSASRQTPAAQHRETRLRGLSIDAKVCVDTLRVCWSTFLSAWTGSFHDLRRRQARSFQTLNNTGYLTPLNFGPDEVSAIVLDIGSATTRMGYAGEDSPRCVVPTSYGYVARQVQSVNAEGMPEEVISRDMYVGENGVGRWRPQMEVANPIADSLSKL